MTAETDVAAAVGVALEDYFVDEDPPTWSTDNADIMEAVGIAVAKAVAFEGWHLIGGSGEPVFANGWGNFDPTRVARFFKTADGAVKIFGGIKTGIVGSAAFTLPAGYRPLVTYGTLTFPVRSNGVFGSVSVDSAGNVVPILPSNNTSVWLDGVSFFTE